MPLYIVATPIGNLEDISRRASRILGEADFVLCEDTRVGKKLLDHYEIKSRLISFHEHSNEKKLQEIIKLLGAGQTLALISDAGTPNLSDPGGKLVNEAIKAGVEVVSVPGPSALTAAIAISGIRMDKFTFFGFLPHKKGRQKELKEIKELKHPAALYESKHRLLKLLKEVSELMPEKKIIIFKELTKKFEGMRRGAAQELLKEIEKDQEFLKGEFVVIIYQAQKYE